MLLPLEQRRTGKWTAGKVPHSILSFFVQEEQQQFELLLNAAKPGEIITLEQPPDMINVEIFPEPRLPRGYKERRSTLQQVTILLTQADGINIL